MTCIYVLQPGRGNFASKVGCETPDSEPEPRPQIAKMYTLAMIRIPATQARQRWAQTMDSARRNPVTITDHGRETVMVLDIEVAHRALRALEDAEDAAAAEATQAAIEAGEETVPLEDMAHELGLKLE